MEQAQKTVSQQLYGITEQTLMRLTETSASSSRVGKRTPWATAMLAKLRRAVGSHPGTYADIWEVTLAPCGGNRRMEWALHTTLTLFALHQQGNTQSMSAEGIPFGKAVRLICQQEPAKEPGVIRRFNALITADSLEEFSHYARGIIQLMKQGGIQMDYPKFASDLFWYQLESTQNSIRMQWGRDFYQTNLNIEGEEV